MKAFIEGIPIELQESAMLDGANDFVIFLSSTSFVPSCPGYHCPFCSRDTGIRGLTLTFIVEETKLNYLAI